MRVGFYDAYGKMVYTSESVGSVLQQVEFPGFDAAAKQVLAITIRYAAPGSRPIESKLTPSLRSATMVKNIFGNNFRLLIDGVDTSRTKKIDPITVTARELLSTSERGAAPAAVRPSNLVITIPLASAQGFQSWLASAAKAPRRGSLQILRPDNTLWATLSLQGIAISKITTQTLDAKVEMALGGVTLTLSQ